MFSKLDANSGFWQIPLTIYTSSKLLTTFLTHNGRYCFNKLPFGISSTPEHFQKRMNQVSLESYAIWTMFLKIPKKIRKGSATNPSCRCHTQPGEVIVISQYEWVILVITQVRSEAEDEGNN